MGLSVRRKAARCGTSEEEKEKMESVRKADAAVKSMHDFTSPEVLYQELIKSVKNLPGERDEIDRQIRKTLEDYLRNK